MSLILIVPQRWDRSTVAIQMVLTCFVVLLSKQVSSFSSGQIGSVCDGMTPFHVPFSSRESKSPYYVQATTNPSGLIDVTITGDDPFKGFFLQALDRQHERVGYFVRIPHHAHYVNCGYQGSAVAHDSSKPKEFITVTWDPSGFKGRVTFRATVVKSYNQYWTEIDAVYTM